MYLCKRSKIIEEWIPTRLNHLLEIWIKREKETDQIKYQINVCLPTEEIRRTFSLPIYATIKDIKQFLPYINNYNVIIDGNIHEDDTYLGLTNLDDENENELTLELNSEQGWQLKEQNNMLIKEKYIENTDEALGVKNTEEMTRVVINSIDQLSQGKGIFEVNSEYKTQSTIPGGEKSDSDQAIIDTTLKFTKIYTNGKTGISTQIPKGLNLITLFIIILIIFSRIGKVNAFYGYDCDNMEIGNKQYSLLDTEDCPEATPSTFISINNNTIYHVYQASLYQTTTIKECKVFRRRFAFNCGHHSWSSIISDGLTKEVIHLTRQQCEDGYVTGEIKIEDARVKAIKNAITYSKIYRAGRITSAAGDCEGGIFSINGEIGRNIVVIDSFEVELREFKGHFDVHSGEMKTHPNCFAKDRFCEYGLTTLIYDVRMEECNVVLLKTTTFDEFKGQNLKEPEEEEVREKRMSQEEIYKKVIGKNSKTNCNGRDN